MNAYVIVAVVLIVAGILGLVYGQFSYTKESQGAKLGPLELTISEKKTVNVPTWAGTGSIVLGAATLGFALIKHQPRWMFRPYLERKSPWSRNAASAGEYAKTVVGLRPKRVFRSANSLATVTAPLAPRGSRVKSKATYPSEYPRNVVS